MSDNEAEDEPYESENESEASLNEDDLLENNKDYNSDVEESDDEGKEPSKPKKKQPKDEKSKKKHMEGEEDDEDVEDIEDDDDDDIELNPTLIEEAKTIDKRFGIVIDPRDLDECAKPNPKMNREIIVDRMKYKSSEYMSLYEFCELVGIRAQHISDGAYVYVEIESETTARDIAKKELQLGKSPFLIKRYMTPINYDPVYIEIWNPNEMAIDSKFFSN